MAEFFETRIENLDKSIPPSVSSRNKKEFKKGSKKRKLVTLLDPEDEDSENSIKTKSFASTMAHMDIPWTCNTLKLLVKQTKQKK